MSISFDYSNALSFMKQSEIENLSEFVKVAHTMIHEKKGPGSDFLGWVDLPFRYDRDEFARIKQAAERIRSTRMLWWSSASEALTWEQGQRLKRCPIASITK